MRFLVDNALSLLLVPQLSDSGHDAIHVRDVGLAAATDIEVVKFAAKEDRIIISADTDFGTILALRKQIKPSFVLLRGNIERRPETQATVLLQQLPRLEEHLVAGAVVVITRDRIRFRRLPFVTE